MVRMNEQLRSRGYIEDEELNNYLHYSKPQLLDMLHSQIPHERTISARLLANHGEKDTLQALIDCLVIEKKLYPKIALSEAIGTYGKEASYLLIGHLGAIGNNQYKALPEKPFEKKNYPLPRDIIARTICKIGVQAFEALRECLSHGTYIQKLEAIDAIGFISYYESDDKLKDDIIEQILIYEEDELMIWKLLRALESFNDEKVIKLLNKYQKSSVIQHRWEANRSLEQIKRKHLL